MELNAIRLPVPEASSWGAQARAVAAEPAAAKPDPIWQMKRRREVVMSGSIDFLSEGVRTHRSRPTGGRMKLVTGSTIGE
jgi:hypothetical protein